VRVVEFAGIGPAPLSGMMLADLGADVVVVERPGGGQIRALVPPRFQVADRGKRRVVVDLKQERGRAQVRELLGRADALVEGFRPGTMERLGLGPEAVHEVNPRLVYARITGWGQTGPRAATAGHDITYLALTGALHAMGRAGEAPVPPMNLVADYAGGTLFGVIGILAAVLGARRSGRGQVVDIAMVDGVGALLAPTRGMLAAGVWRDERGVNLLDTGAPFYDVYETRDGRYLAIGALEDEFFAQLVRGLGLDESWTGRRWDRAAWPALRDEIARVVATRGRDEWDAVFAATDACVAPVLSLAESAADPHLRARAALIEVGGVVQPAAAPRFDRTPAPPPAPPEEAVSQVEELVRDWAGPS
jgi:alpha-methylacyl-CoA racemase